MKNKIDWKHFEGSHWTFEGEGLRHFSVISYSKKNRLVYLRSELTAEVRSVLLSEIQNPDLWSQNWKLIIDKSPNTMQI
jgi:hypothetical protein